MSQLLLGQHPGPEPTIAEAFERFHAENPEVYATLRRLAFEWKKRRADRCGMKMLFEVARWQMNLKTTGEPFVLNNNFTSYYARLLMENEPELDGLFQTRKLHGPEAEAA